MNSKYRPLIIGGVILFLCDLALVVTMIVNPDLTERIIPALVAIQILGFIGIAIAYLSRGQKPDNVGGALGNQTQSSKEWAKWLLGGLAMLFILRALLASGYMAVHGWHGQQVLVPVTEIGIACYLLYLAFSIGRGTRNKKSETRDEAGQRKE